MVVELTLELSFPLWFFVGLRFYPFCGLVFGCGLLWGF